MTISFSGLASGLDTSSWVSSLVALKRAKVETYQAEKENVLLSQETLNSIKSFFSSFRNVIERVTDTKFGIGSMDLFAQNLATSSNLNVLTASATTEAEEAVYNVEVSQLATNTQAASGYKYLTTIVETTTATSNSLLKDIGVTAGEIQIYTAGGYKTLEITNSDTIRSFIEKLSDIGVSANYNENTGVFSANLNTSDINDVDNTGIVDALHLESSKGYESGTLQVSKIETVYRPAERSTLLSDLGVNAGTLTIRQDDTFEYDINIEDGDTLGDLLDAFQANGIDSVLSNGNLTLNGAVEFVDDGATNFIDAFGFTKTDSTDTSQISKDLTTEVHLAADENTLLSELGITSSSSTTLTIYSNSGSVLYSNTLNPNYNLGHVIEIINNNSNGEITASIEDGVIKIESTGNAQIAGTLADALGITGTSTAHSPVINTSYTSTAPVTMTNIVEGTKVATENDLISDFVDLSALNDNEVIARDYLGKLLGTTTVTSTMTFGELFDWLEDYDITCTLEDGVISLESNSGNVVESYLFEALGLQLIRYEDAAHVGNPITSDALTVTVTNTTTSTQVTTTLVTYTIPSTQVTTIYTTTTSAATYTTTIYTTTTSTATRTTTTYSTSTIASTQLTTITVTVTGSSTMKSITIQDTSGMTKLSAISESSTISSGTYSISTTEELAKLATMTNAGKITGGTFILGANIDLSSYSSGTGWTPIGTSSNHFKGTFNGNGYVISNLNINSSDSYVGLFGYSDGSILNVGLENVDIKGYDYVGGLVGYSTAGIQNCYATGAVTGEDYYVGGLVGYTSSFVSYSYASVNVTGDAFVGGLIGSTSGAAIYECYSTGSVTGYNDSIGGLIGDASNSALYIRSCYATGNVTAVGACSIVGGLVGDFNGNYIYGSYASGNVVNEGGNQTGGLVGRCDAGSIVASYTTGYVIGYDEIGGLVGELATGSIGRCYTTGDINGRLNVGGVIGTMYNGALSGCYATGHVFGDSGDVGGLVGFIPDADYINNCYFTGSVHTNASDCSTVGGLVGFLMTGETITISASSVLNESGDEAGIFVGRAQRTALILTENKYLSSSKDLVGEMSGGTLTESNNYIDNSGSGAPYTYSYNYSLPTTNINKTTYTETETKTVYTTNTIATTSTQTITTTNTIATTQTQTVYTTNTVATTKTQTISTTETFATTSTQTISTTTTSITSVTEATTLGQLGLTRYRTYTIAEEGFASIAYKVFTLKPTDTIGDFFSQLSSCGLSPKLIRDDTFSEIFGRIGYDISIAANDNVYIQSMDSELENVLKIQTGSSYSYDCAAKYANETESNCSLTVGITTTVVSTMTEETTLADLGITSSQAISITNVMTGRSNPIKFSTNTTVGDLISKINSSSTGVKATLANGKITLTDSNNTHFYISSMSSDLKNALNLNYTNPNYKKYYTYTNSDSQKLSLTAASSPTLDTKLSDMGITQGTFTVDGNTISIAQGDTVSDLITKLNNAGIDASLESSGDGNCNYIKIDGLVTSSSDSNASNITNILNFTNNAVYNYSAYLTAPVLETVIYNAEESTKLSYYDNGYLQAAGDLALVIDGQETSIYISANETFGSLIAKLKSVGLEASLDNGKFVVYSPKDFSITAGSSNLAATLGLTYSADISDIASSSEIVTQSIFTETIGVRSISNWANYNTKLGDLNITSGTLSLYRNGYKEILQIDSEQTLGDLRALVSSKFSDVDLKIQDGKLVFESSSGAIIEAGSSIDTSNFLAITGLEKDSLTGSVKGTQELFRANTDSLIMESDLFRAGNVTEGTFTIGNAVFNVDKTTKISDLISQINSNEESNATAYWDAINGKLIIKSRTSGAGLINIEAGTSNFTDIMGLTSSEWNSDGSLKNTRLNVDFQDIGENAQFTINGTNYISTSNTVTSDLTRIKGLTINLKGLTEGSSVTLTVERDKEALADAISDVVDSYNELMENVDNAIAINGNLHDQSTLKLIRNQLRTLMTGSESGVSVFKNLDAIGIGVSAASGNNLSTTNQSIINLSFDKEKFLSAYEADKDALKSLLVGGENNSGILTKVEELLENALKGVTGYFDIANTSYERKVSTLDTKISKLNTLADRYKARLEAKFQSMDLLISNIQNQYSSFLGV